MAKKSGAEVRRKRRLRLVLYKDLFGNRIFPSQYLYQPQGEVRVRENLTSKQEEMWLRFARSKKTPLCGVSELQADEALLKLVVSAVGDRLKIKKIGGDPIVWELNWIQ
jgi:hypothetical protein